MVSPLFFYFFFLALGATVTTSAVLVLRREKRDRREGSNIMQSIPLQFRHSSVDVELQASPVQPPSALTRLAWRDPASASSQTLSRMTHSVLA